MIGTPFRIALAALVATLAAQADPLLGTAGFPSSDPFDQIIIRDYSEGPLSVTLVTIGSEPGSISNVVINGEQLTFTYDLASGGTWNDNYDFYTQLFDASGAVSDTFRVQTIKYTAEADITFASGTLLNVGSSKPSGFSGLEQTGFNVLADFGPQPPSAGDISGEFIVDTPEPSGLMGLALGLACLALASRRRWQMQ